MDKELTPRQRDVLIAINKYRDDNDFRCPSYEDLSKMLGLSTRNGVRDTLQILRRKGYVTWNGVRTLRVIKDIPELEAEAS